MFTTVNEAAERETEANMSCLAPFSGSWTHRLLRRPVIWGIILIAVFIIYWMTTETQHLNTNNVTAKYPNNKGEIKQMDKILDGVKVRFYVQEALPANNNKAIVYIHGGGWIGGSIGSANSFCRSIAKAVDAVVISIEYRLAPKHPYPAAMLDCYKATSYIILHAREHGIDPNRIALAGHSAGGNLVAAVALRLRDFKVEPQPKLQVLLNACLQAIDFNTPSYQLNGNGPGLSLGTMASMWAQYALGKSLHAATLMANQHTSAEIKLLTSQNRLNHALILKDYPLHDKYNKQRVDFGDGKLWKRIESVFTDPYFAPLMAEDVSNLPEAVIFTNENDILRDDGMWYARYLRISNVKVTHRHFKGGHSEIINPNRKSNAVALKTLFALIRQKL